MADSDKTIDGFAFWIENEENGVCYIPLNLCKKIMKLLKEQKTVVRCKDCKHLFDGEHTKNCCDVLMGKAGWLKEISVSPDWFCADGERR